ncbi:D-arabinono-1,4-lactone oxidase [Fluviicoccus keumensis]|uniref:D-arabinono-1,4-lactone oxidase n=1 Tax=Fluviicoccus keumensis TaxID=1435465 RepID=A0A4Q7ZCW7_9GAMM|nr:FAD-binding protein [Fluviicoccus keumensis]RZU47845.1 D-arabinono-1,4-lactone oxidase [Fluviicoccus keumensis]
MNRTRISAPLLTRLLALAALGGALAGCDEWSNVMQTEKVTPQYRAQPDSAKQLMSYISTASSNGKRVRMTGSGHSASDIAITNEVLFTPEKLNQPLNLDRARLKNPADDKLVRVMSGMRIREMNTFLDSKGLAFTNLGGYDGQTIAGVMMTATHGSGLAYGPIADQVQSIQMVVEGGRMVQIEPTNGITNPLTFPRKLEEDSTIPVELIQDDNAFNAARVSFGSMGVIYSVVLKADTKFWLREVRTKVKWSDIKKPGGPLERLLQGLPVNATGPSPEHWELQYTPYADDNGDHTFLITERFRSYTPLPEQPASERGQPGTDFVSGLITVMEMPLAGIIDTFPSLSKVILEQTMTSQADDNYTNVSYKVFHIGVVNDTPAIAIEAAFDYNQTVAAIERSFALSDSLFSQNIVHTSPIAIRFVKKTDALVAMQNGRNSMFMEVIGLKDSKSTQPLLKTYQRTMYQELGARPHWGLDLNLLTSESQLRGLYPKWDLWKTQQRRFNGGTFDGKVTDRLGISVRPR